MTMQDIIAEMLKHPECFTEGYEDIYEPDGSIVRKRCKKLEVTYGLILEFCHKHELPLPDEMMCVEFGGNDV